MRVNINLLYTNGEVILRELISNSAHTLDNMRFLNLTKRRSTSTGTTSACAS